ncbi:MAG: GxxExxY protein [Povalibacter sp.]
MNDIWQICNAVRQTAFGVHAHFKNGFLERVYQNALAHRLQKLELQVQQQPQLRVFDEDGTVVGEYFPDLVVANAVIVEIKAVNSLISEHEAQVLGYLRCSRLEHALLINFGARRFQIRKFVLSAHENESAVQAFESNL